MVEGYMVVPDSPEMDEIIRISRLKYNIENCFTYHPPTEGQPAKYEAIRAKAKELALELAKLCPGSLELDRSLERLDEVVFWANASIARNS